MKLLTATNSSLRLKATVGACLLLLAQLAWADVDQASLEAAEGLLKAGKAEEAYQMLEPLEQNGAGDLVYDYLLGTAALESNRPSKATFVYERILAVAPEYVGVRADMGRAYYALGDYGRAKVEFETVLSFQNLPQDLRASVEQYVKAAEAYAQNKRTVGNGYVEVGIGLDTNIGSSNSANSLIFPVGGTVYAPDRKPDTYSTLGLGGELNHQISDRVGAYVGGDYRGRAYKTYCDNTCNYSVDVRGGLSYSGGAWLVKTGINAGTYELNKKAYRDTLGVTVDWRLALANGSQLSAGASSSRASYLDTTTIDQNSQTNTLTVGWLTPLGDGSSIFSISASGGVEMAVGGRTDGDKRFSGPRLLFQTSFSDKLGGYITSGATSSRYSGINAYYGVARDETLVDLALGLTWALRKGASLRPQLSALRNTSNAELYSYDKADASVNLRLDF